MPTDHVRALAGLVPGGLVPGGLVPGDPAWGGLALTDVLLGGLALAMLVAIGRVAFGPDRADRLLGMDFGFAVLIATVAVLALRLEAPALLHLVLAATLIGFLGTVAIAALAERGRP